MERVENLWIINDTEYLPDGAQIMPYSRRLFTRVANQLKYVEQTRPSVIAINSEDLCSIILDSMYFFQTEFQEALDILRLPLSPKIIASGGFDLKRKLEETSKCPVRINYLNKETLSRDITAYQLLPK